MEPCKACQNEISEDATRCGHCGYEPRTDGHTARTIGLFVGLGLTLTGVGAIVGVPLIAACVYGHNKAQNLKPTNHVPT